MVLRGLKFFQFAILLCVISLVSACDLYEESWVSSEKIQVKEERFFEQVPVAKMDAGAVSALSKYYGRYGDGEIVLSVTYDPHSKTYTAMKAGDDMARLVQVFRRNGMDNVEAGILPVWEGDAQQVLVSFTSYKAEAPKGCTTMPGFKSNVVERDEDYALGCTVETLFARQVARPKDLLGRGQSQATVDGRRTANVVVTYRDGVPNKPLKGETASE